MTDFLRCAALLVGLTLVVAFIAYAITSETIESDPLGGPGPGAHSDEGATTTVASAIGGAMFEIEADVFTDTTLVKFERDVKEWYETSTKDKDALIAEIAQHFNVNADDVAAVIDFEVENRASRAKDRE